MRYFEIFEKCRYKKKEFYVFCNFIIFCFRFFSIDIFRLKNLTFFRHTTCHDILMRMTREREKHIKHSNYIINVLTCFRDTENVTCVRGTDKQI